MPKAIELIHRELKKLREIKLSPVLLHTAQKQLKGQLALSLESHQNEMLAMGKNMLVYGKVDPVEEIYRRINSITAEDISVIANEIFYPGNLSTLIFNNQKNSSI
jgi:predicted Zn-dependent peptidase